MGVEASSKVHSQPPQGSYIFYSPKNCMMAGIEIRYLGTAPAGTECGAAIVSTSQLETGSFTQIKSADGSSH